MKAVILCHPQSADLVSDNVFDTISKIRISCGTTKVENSDLSESNDFFPTYASWNSCLFETSVILTVWEHMNQLIGDDSIAILHTDIEPHFDASEIWEKVDGWLSEDQDRAVGLVAASSFRYSWSDWEIPVDLTPENDPMMLHSFDNSINVWDFIKKYDVDVFEWAMDTQPRLVYSHQFACSGNLFAILGNKLYDVAHRLRLADIGFWTPHMFERLIALYLARFGNNPILSTAFWHHSSSGVAGPGSYSLYGPRPLKYYALRPRFNSRRAIVDEI